MHSPQTTLPMLANVDHRGSNHSAAMSSKSVHGVHVLAHDLRGPLANLSLLIERLGALADPAAERAVAACLEKADRLISRMDDLLRHSVRQVDKVQTSDDQTLRVAVADVVETVVASNEAMAEDRGVALDCDIQTDVMVDADSSLLGRALDNLLTNAVKHTPAGGAVTVGATEGNGHVSLIIRDQGPGFSPEDMERMFQPFATLSARDPRGAPSHGLGMCIAKSIVERLGGTISAGNNADGIGAILTIELPLIRH